MALYYIRLGKQMERLLQTAARRGLNNVEVNLLSVGKK